jgi:hypothetical protein
VKAITTRYHGPTNYRGARISAEAPDNPRIYIPYPYGLDSDAAHRLAAQALCDRMAWTGGLIGGGTKDGMVWVFDCGLIAAAETLMRHAQERYPHFEGERGTGDIAAVEQAIAWSRE